MRITASNAHESTIKQLQRRQEQLTESQQQLTSGKRILRASDDPAGAARAERAMVAMARAEADQRALDASNNAMTLAESALGDAGELLQQARELMVGAGNGSYNDADRKTLAERLLGLRADLLAVANRSDGAGRYLFGGQGSEQPPLVDGLAGVSYTGLGGQLQALSVNGAPLSIDGRAAWLEAPDPDVLGGSLSVFDVLDTAAAELMTPGRPMSAVAQTVSEGLGRIDAVSANLSSWRSRAGDALNRIDGMSARLGQTKLDAQRERSEVEDLDMVAAISEFQNRQSGYDAALKTYSIVQRMSLFEYIR